VHSKNNGSKIFAKASLPIFVVAGFLSASPVSACCRNYAEFAADCSAHGGIPSKNPLKCSPRPQAPSSSPPTSGPSNSAPGPDYGAEAAAATQAAAEVQRRKEDAERQARFVQDRDAAARTLKGSIGTSAGANSPGGSELRGSAPVAIGRQLRSGVQPPDAGGRQAAWKQLHCAASILGPGISAAIDKSDYAEFRFLADEAANALDGQRLRVTCAPAPEMPKASGRAADPGRMIESEKRLVAKARDLATKLEDAQRAQKQAQATLRGEAAPKVDAATTDAVEQQRRINRARDNAGNEMARAQREFNEGKRSEDGAKRELKKIQEKVESVVKGERVTFDEEPPAVSKAKNQ